MTMLLKLLIDQQGHVIWLWAPLTEYNSQQGSWEIEMKWFRLKFLPEPDTWYIMLNEGWYSWTKSLGCRCDVETVVWGVFWEKKKTVKE